MLIDTICKLTNRSDILSIVCSINDTIDIELAVEELRLWNAKEDFNQGDN